LILRAAGIALGAVVALALVVVGYARFSDGRSLVRIQGKRYARELVRADEPAIRVALTKRVAQKYALEPSQLPGENLWFFRLDPRPTG
jgi:hypothetical protein